MNSSAISLGNMLFHNILKTLVALDHLHDQVSLVDFDVLEDVLVELFVFAANSAIEMTVFDVAREDLGADAVLVVDDVLNGEGNTVLVDEIFDHAFYFGASFPLELDRGVSEKVFTLLVQILIGNTEVGLIFLVQESNVSIIIIYSIELPIAGSLLAPPGFGYQIFSFFFSESSQSDPLTLLLFEAEHELVSVIIV